MNVTRIGGEAAGQWSSGAKLYGLALAGTALGAGVTSGPALAQTASPAGQDGTMIILPEVNVQASPIERNGLNTTSGIARLPGTVQDTPQVVNVITQETLREQNVTTVEQALRNVPGITVAIGEANGGPNGDQFRIRGFEAKGDSYLDGLRDFGVYTRDSFNVEQIQVLKGPSSEGFGYGTVGGAISSASRQARLGSEGSVDGTFGSGPLARGTFDVNQQIGETTALRLTGMLNRQNIVDRDTVQSNRWGLAGSLGMGIGTDTTWYLNYFHQSNNRTPDYGVPLIGRTATSVRRPVTEFGVPRSIFYGKTTDTDRSDVDMVTSRFSTRVNDWLTISNDTRYTNFYRHFSTTTATCDQACANTFFNGGNPFVTYGAGGGPSYDQTSWGLQNILTGTARFDTGPLRHEAILGLDTSYQRDKRQGLSYSPSKGPLPRLLTPNYLGTYGLIDNVNNVKRSESENYALFASDRVWFTPEWSALVGVRWDYFDTSYDLKGATSTANPSGRTVTDADANFFSPRASLIWEPTPEQTYYVSYSTAAVLPFGQYVTSDVNPVVSARTGLDPETSQSYEVGAKYNLLNQRLGLTAALFQVTKDNTFYTDPTTGAATQTGDKQRVRGVELGLTGNLTEAWTMNLAYAYLAGRTTASTNAALVGAPVQGVPVNSASLWTTYDIREPFRLPGTLTLGGGITYRDSVYIRSDKMSEVPYSLAVDALVSYQQGRYRLALNGYNLGNRTNYDNFFQGENANTSRAIPSAGRTILVSLGVTF